MTATKTFAIVFLISLSFSLSDSARADQTMSLNGFLEAVRKENLALKEADAKTEAKKAGAKGLGLPAPMAGPMWNSLGDGTGFEISQQIPFPGRIAADREARAFEADAQSASQNALEREILARAKLAYFRLWQSREKATLLRERIRAIKQHLKLATAGARSDSFQKIHILKAESDLDLLENDLIQTHQETRERQIEASRLLDRDPAGFKMSTEIPPLSPVPARAAIDSPFQLALPRLELERERARERFARRSWFPELSLRYRQMPRSMMSPESSEFMVGFSLPFFFFSDPSAEAEQGTAARTAAEWRLADERRKISADQEILLARTESLLQQIRQINESLIPRVEKRTRLVHNLAPRDLETLQDHRETMEALPELKMKALELRMQYEATVAELEKYLSEKAQ